MGVLSRREGSNVKAFSLTWGWVNDSLGVYPGINPIAVKEKCNLQRPDPCPYTAEEGAAITVFCALRSTVSGGYYSRIRRCQEDAVEGNGFQDQMRVELYNRSLHLAKVPPDSETLVIWRLPSLLYLAAA